eukprot:200754_1
MSWTECAWLWKQCIWKLKVQTEEDSAIEIVNTWFGRCIMRSEAALSYEQSQGIGSLMIRQIKHKLQSLRNLLRVSKLFKIERIKQGVLSLSSLKPSFTFK